MQRKILISIIILVVFSALILCCCHNGSGKAASTKESTATVSQQEQTANTDQKTIDNQQQNQNAEQQPIKQTTTSNNKTQQQTNQTTTTTKTSSAKTDKLTCTLSVSCASIFDHLDSFNSDKLELVPEDGIVFYKKDCEFTKGESVFDVLKRELLAAEIHFEFSTTPVYNTNYVEAIDNIYEFDGGDFTGWKYKVNGTFPGCGCSLYKVSDGDVIEWVYTFNY